jgi:hypothetical protein
MKQFARLREYLWSVVKHFYVLLATILGSVIIGIWGLLPDVLREQYLKPFEGLADYSFEIAMGVLFCGFAYASFLAWNEERDELHTEQAKVSAAQDEIARLKDQRNPHFKIEIKQAAIEIDQENANYRNIYLKAELLKPGPPSLARKWGADHRTGGQDRTHRIHNSMGERE